MRLKLNIFFLLTLALLFSSCREEFLNPYPENSEYENGTGNGLRFVIDDCTLRTRDVNFQPGASVRINKVWLGIFDIESGECVSNNSFEMNYVPVQTGVTRNGVIRRTLNDPKDYNEATDKDRKYIMVSVANYGNVLVGNPTDELNDENQPENYDADQGLEDASETENHLSYQLRNVKTWEDFQKISVDAISAYQYPHDSDTPVFAGFLNSESYYDDESDSNNPHVKVDQFRRKTDGTGVDNSKRIMLSPSYLMNSLIIKFRKVQKEVQNVETGKTETKMVGEYYDEASGKSINDVKVLFLRRLVANIMVNVTVDNEDLELTDVYYRRVNMPAAVYLIERKTTDCYWENENDPNTFKNGDFPMEDNTQGHNDRILTANYGDNNPTSEKHGYYSDPDTEQGWIRSINPTFFSFQHFANKHWSNLDASDNGKLVYDGEEIDREDFYLDGNGNRIYKALVPKGSELGAEHYNNFASYFIIRMHMIDKKTGRALEAEYTIHEGNTSDETGVGCYNEDGSPKGNVKDFSTGRNINYTYNVIVQGVNSIYHNVYADDNAPGHASGQGGKIWEMHYASEGGYYDANENGFRNAVPPTGGTFPFGWEHEKNAQGEEMEGDDHAIYFEIDIEKPDLAFRLYGVNTTADDPKDWKIEGFNYNFPTQSFEWLRGLWPPAILNPHFFLNRDAVIASIDLPDGDPNKIPKCYTDGLKIIDQEESPQLERDLPQFIEYIYKGLPEKGITNGKRKFSMVVKETDINSKVPWYEIDFDNRQDYVRAIYLADRNGKYDEDNCTRIVKIFTGAQYPDHIHSKTYNMLGAYGENHFDKGEGTLLTINNNLPGNFKGKDYSETGMLFQYGTDASDRPDIAFRLLGYDSEGKYHDICYNFDPDDYPAYYDRWPAKTDGVTEVYKGTLVGNITYPTDLLNGLKVIENNGDKKNIKDFVLDVQSGKIGAQGFEVSQYNYKVNTSAPEKYKRALYLFDKSSFTKPGRFLIDNKHVDSENNPLPDNKPCAYEHRVLFHIYAVEQYPEVAEPEEEVEFSINDMIYHDAIHKISRNQWCGSKNSATEIMWYHKDGIIGYEVTVEGGNSNKRNDKFTITATGLKDNLVSVGSVPSGSDYKSQLTTVNGKKAVKILHSQYGWDNTNYNVTVKPIVDDTKYKEANAVTVTGKYTIVDCKWDLSQAPWKGIDANPLTTDKTIEYDGLEVFSDGKVSTNGNGFNLGGPGNTSNKYIRIWINRPGTLSITYATNSGNNDKRHPIILKQNTDGSFTTLGTLEDSYSSTSPITRTLDITEDNVGEPLTVDKPYQIYIYGDGADVRFQKIEFIKK